MEIESAVSLFVRGKWRYRFQLLIIWLTGLCVVFTALWSIAQILLIQLNPAYAPSKPAEPPAPEVPAFRFSYELKEITVPLFSKELNRVMYARFSISLDLPSAEAKDVFEKSKARVIDIILSVAASFYLEDFKGPESFSKFKTELLNGIRSKFPGSSPRQIALEDWTVG